MRTSIFQINIIYCTLLLIKQHHTYKSAAPERCNDQSGEQHRKTGHNYCLPKPLFLEDIEEEQRQHRRNVEFRCQRQREKQHILPFIGRKFTSRDTRLRQIIDRNDQKDRRDQIQLPMHVGRIQNDRRHKIQHQYILAP